MEDMVLMNTMIEYGVHEDGHHYAYVNLNCFRKSKEVTISFLAIKLGEKWYLGDELRLGEPKKIKRIDLEKYEKYLPNMGNWMSFSQTSSIYFVGNFIGAFIVVEYPEINIAS